MSTLYWTGQAAAVAQVAQGTINSVDATPANNTFTVTVGGVAVSVPGNTSANQTAVDLAAALNASTHPYFAAITWAAPGSGVVRGTADVAGVPFVATLTETGAGTGAVTDFADTTASAGPHDVTSAGNWSTGAVPTTGDVVILEGGGADLLWGLDGLADTVARLEVRGTWTGKIGLDHQVFATSEDGATTVDYPEYRAHYWSLPYDRAELGAHAGPGTPAYSQRIKLDNPKSGASVTVVHQTATASAETNRPAVRLKANHASADVEVRAAQGGVGLAFDVPGEAATFGDVAIAGGNVTIGAGVTYAALTVTGGAVVANSAGTLAAATVKGGAVTLEGDFTVTALTVEGGAVYPNQVKTGGNAITAGTQSGGTVDATRSPGARTWAAWTQTGGTLDIDADAVTITAWNQPPSARRITVAPR